MKPNLSKLSHLKGKTVSTGVYQDINAVVTDVAGWPTGTTLRWFWLDNEDADESV